MSLGEPFKFDAAIPGFTGQIATGEDTDRINVPSLAVAGPLILSDGWTGQFYARDDKDASVLVTITNGRVTAVDAV